MSGMWLVRHGALPPNPERRMVGAREIPLSDEGRAQVKRLSRQFIPAPDGRIAAVLCSDLERCRETASILLSAPEWGANQPPLHLEPGLRELNLGQWQGLTRAEIEERIPGQYDMRGKEMARFRPAGGESFCDLQERALSALARWRKRYPDQTLLAVTHGGVMGSLLSHYLALPLADVLKIRLYYGCRVFLPDW